jgi:hypothetical protein
LVKVLNCCVADAAISALVLAIPLAVDPTCDATVWPT